jgi:hypothetical protein
MERKQTSKRAYKTDASGLEKYCEVLSRGRPRSISGDITKATPNTVNALMKMGGL